MSGTLPTHVKVKIPNSSFVNLFRAVVERVFLVKNNGQLVRPPGGDERLFNERMLVFRRLLIAQLPHLAPMTRQQFVDSYKIGRKRNLYARAVESLNIRLYDQSDARIRAFLKIEKIIEAIEDPDKPYRVIHPRSPRYNVMLGCYLKHLEHIIFDVIAEIFGGETTVAKGLNGLAVAALARSKWLKFQNPVAVGLDASRFDQHVRQFALRWEHSIYESVYPNDAILHELLGEQLENKVTAMCDDAILFYKTDGCRMSGDMNTSLGNCILMCGMVYSYTREKNIQCSLLNNGDDCVVFMEGDDLLRFNEGLADWFTQLGFTMKVEPPAYKFEDIEFCQSKFVHNGMAYVMCRNYPNAIAKDSTSIMSLRSPDERLSWFKSTSDQGLALASGVPIFQAFYSALRRAAGDSNPVTNDLLTESGLWWLSRDMVEDIRPISTDARISFYLAYGIEPFEQERIEHFYDTLVLTPQLTAAPPKATN